MAKVPYGVETLSKISIVWVGRTNVTDDRRQTDGRWHIANMNLSSRSLKIETRFESFLFECVHCRGFVYLTHRGEDARSRVSGQAACPAVVCSCHPLTERYGPPPRHRLKFRRPVIFDRRSDFQKKRIILHSVSIVNNVSTEEKAIFFLMQA